MPSEHYRPAEGSVLRGQESRRQTGASRSTARGSYAKETQGSSSPRYPYTALTICS